MAIKHNNQLPNVHFHKDWQRRIKTWFNQPGRKERRRLNRVKKAARVAPRPLDGLLRPAVRCPTLKYNTRMRAGRGFTLEELKAAGIPRRQALTIGISVDHRRKNRSEESLAGNIKRLKAYKGRLILFPRKSSKPKKGDSCKEDLDKATQLGSGKLFPVVTHIVKDKARAITEDEKKANQRHKLKMAWKEEKIKGIKEKKRRERAEEEANKVKK